MHHTHVHTRMNLAYNVGIHLYDVRWPFKNAGGPSQAPADTRHLQRPVLSWVARLRPARAARKRPPYTQHACCNMPSPRVPGRSHASDRASIAAVMLTAFSSSRRRRGGHGAMPLCVWKAMLSLGQALAPGNPVISATNMYVPCSRWSLVQCPQPDSPGSVRHLEHWRLGLLQ